MSKFYYGNTGGSLSSFCMEKTSIEEHDGGKSADEEKIDILYKNWQTAREAQDLVYADNTAIFAP